MDAIEKARYIMDAIDRLNADWRTRKDKDHPLLHDPCQVKVSMIKGGHHPSSYAGQCVISLDIQSLPHEQNEQNLPMSVRAEVEDYLRRVCEADPWLRENPVEIVWKLDADCCEIAPDHPFVKVLQKNVQDHQRRGQAVRHDFPLRWRLVWHAEWSALRVLWPGDIFSAPSQQRDLRSMAALRLRQGARGRLQRMVFAGKMNRQNIATRGIAA